MQSNREAQEESLRRREELIQELELEREIRRQEREREEGRKTARMQEINAQVRRYTGWLVFSLHFLPPQTKVCHLDFTDTESQPLTMMPQ